MAMKVLRSLLESTWSIFKDCRYFMCDYRHTDDPKEQSALNAAAAIVITEVCEREGFLERLVCQRSDPS